MQPYMYMIISNIIGNFLWGFYTCIFLVTLWVMKVRKASFTPALLAIILLYCFNFAGTVLQTYLSMPTVTAFVVGESQSWATFNSTMYNAMADLTLFLSCWIADCTICWRMWIVWSRDYRVLILPGAQLLFGIVGGVLIVTWDATGIIHHPSYAALSEAMLGSSAFLNVYVTSLTVGRLWYVSSRVRNICSARQTASRYETFILAMIESSIILTLCTVVFAVLLAVNLDDRLLFQNFYVYAVGISPTLILLKLSLGYLQPSDSVVGTTPTSKNGGLSAPKSRRQDDLSCDLSDLETTDASSASRLGEKSDYKGAYGPSSPTATMEGRDSGHLEIYVDTNAATHMV